MRGVVGNVAAIGRPDGIRATVLERQPGSNAAREFHDPNVSTTITRQLFSIRGDRCHAACARDGSEIPALPIAPNILPAAALAGDVREHSLAGRAASQCGPAAWAMPCA